MKQKNDIQRGIKITTFNTFMILASCILYICLLMATVYATRNYEQLARTTNEYIQLEDAAKDILKASDYLTEQVRLYAQTQDPDHARLYFEEANIARRRENALDIMRRHSLDPSREEGLELAVYTSNELMIREIYAMKLVAVAQGHDETELPMEVNAVSLELEDMDLTPQEKLDKARMMLFDSEYQNMKNTIYTHLDFFTQGVLHTTESGMVEGLDHLSQSIMTQRLLLSVLFVLNGITFLVITLLVVKPLKIFLRCIQDRSLFCVTGAYEFQCLAQVYNDIYKRSDLLAASEARLRKKAERDGLTGILNRYMFQEVGKLLSESVTPLALVLMDVDEFKSINDMYGHAVGDEVLIRVAHTLKENLRGSDYVFRIGGDEFAVILPEISRDQAESIRNKLLRINENLQHPQGNDVAVSLSIGVALSEHGYREELYQQADQALYWVKEHGRKGCMVYSQDMKEQK